MVVNPKRFSTLQFGLGCGRGFDQRAVLAKS
jgi:hypothetical protein